MPKSMMTRVIAVDHDVGRLEIAMHDAGVVRGLQARGDLPGERHDLRDRQALLAQDRRQVAALDVRHRDVLDAVDLAEVVNADDVLVRDLTREEQLLLEAPLDVLRGAWHPASPPAE